MGLGEEATHAKLLRGSHGGAAVQERERSGKERNEAGVKEGEGQRRGALPAGGSSELGRAEGHWIRATAGGVLLV